MDLNTLRSVDRFYIVQADGLEDLEKTIVEEKEFRNIQDAVSLIKKSQAPVKYIKFNYQGNTYKLYPIRGTDEYKIVYQPIIN